jgi:hypothetical protein
VKLPIETNRRNVLRLLAACAAGALLDGFWIEPKRLSVTRRDVTCKKLAPGCYRIFISGRIGTPDCWEK